MIFFYKMKKDIIYDKQRTSKKFDDILNKFDGKEIVEEKEEDLEQRVEEEFKNSQLDHDIPDVIPGADSKLNQLEQLKQIERIIEEDPFKINKIAEYEIVEFMPTKHIEGLEKYIM